MKDKPMQKELEELLSAVLCNRFGTKNRSELIQRIEHLLELEAKKSIRKNFGKEIKINGNPQQLKDIEQTIKKLSRE